MNIGIPKERRTFEFRVGMTPAGVHALIVAGHTCYIEHAAGLGAGFTDQDYEKAGGHIVYSAQEAFGRADLLLKVARPLAEELEWLRPGSVVTGLLHLASARQDKIDFMQQKELTAIAYEQIQLADGSLPVRKPLSQIGGRLAAQIGARLLQNDSGGKGILLGGIAGVPPAEVVVIGTGIAGTCAVHAFAEMGAHVTALDRDLNALERIYDLHMNIVTMVANPRTIAKTCAYADIVVGAIITPGERPDIIITREIIRSMKPRSVIMDISIDEGGCVETSRPTTHEHPYYIEEGVVHYCVPNIPSVVARTSTYAYLNAAFPFIMEIANKGVDAAIEENPAIEQGVAVHKGLLAHTPHLNSIK
jgi:alanine dehydrogenase